MLAYMDNPPRTFLRGTNVHNGGWGGGGGGGTMEPVLYVY